jgi:hypothetical protein
MKLLLPLLLLAHPVNAAVKYRGEVALESRAFEGDNDARTEDANIAAAGRVDLRAKFGGLRQRLRLFGRADVYDSQRNRLNIEEAYIGWRAGGWRLRLGAQMLNWTAAEAFHPADIINSRNFDSNVENAEKIGEPMLWGKRKIGPGALSALFMPLRISPQIPGGSSRIGFAPPGFNIGEALWVGEDGSLSRDSFAPQGALRYRQNLGPADISLHAVRHFDRSQPVLVFDATANKFQPLYLPVTQLGGTYQQVLGAFVVKLEGAYRSFNNPDRATPLGIVSQKNHGLAAFGLEYGFDQLGGAETTFIVEGQSVLGQNKATRANISLFQRDFLFGLRRAFNDTKSREIFASFIVDTERSNEYLFNISYSQRLTDTYSISTGGRLTQAPQKRAVAQGLEILHGANQIFLTLKRHF